MSPGFPVDGGGSRADWRDDDQHRDRSASSRSRSRSPTVQAEVSVLDENNRHRAAEQQGGRRDGSRRGRGRSWSWRARARARDELATDGSTEDEGGALAAPPNDRVVPRVLVAPRVLIAASVLAATRAPVAGAPVAASINAFALAALRFRLATVAAAVVAAAATVTVIVMLTHPARLPVPALFPLTTSTARARSLDAVATPRLRVAMGA